MPLRFPSFLAAMSVVGFAVSASAADVSLELKKGDTIVLVGNTLPERMMWYPHFEAVLQASLPGEQLSLRNMGWSADEVNLRPRPLNFGTPDDHLKRLQADVVLLFFGGNEAFAGEKGLDGFKAELTKAIEHLRAEVYNGESPPRIAVVSPIPMEDIGDPLVPNGKAHNADLKAYTDAMREVAAERKVAFADVFTPMLPKLAKSDSQLTMNGLHLNDAGYAEFGSVLVDALGIDRAVVDEKAYGPLLAAVREKDTQWWYRHRAVNGEYIYGRRKKPFGVNNFPQEMEKLDEMLAVRDRHIWAVAGGDLDHEIDDSKTLTLKAMPTNFNRPIEILSPDDSLKKLKVHPDYEVNLFASEVEFPELENPVAMTWDQAGRLWVSVMPTYPQYLPGKPANDKLLVFEDTDRDGKADEMTVFADGLHVPVGFAVGDGGAYVAQPPNLWFMKDTDGDGKADEKKIVLHGFGTEDSHHAISAFTWSPGGVLHFQEGTFHHSQVETPWGPTRLVNAGVFGFEPKRQKLEVFVSYGFANPWGHTYDHWGQNFVADASGGANYFGTAFSGHTQYPRKHGRLKQFIKKRVRPTCGCEFVHSRQFPENAQGNFLLNNTIGFQGVLQHTVKEEGSGFAGTEIEPILVSSDPNFRPTDLEFGPDGCLYLVDWFNPLIGHMQHNLRDPNRDHSHGRVWRVRAKGRDVLEYPKIAGQPLPKVIEHLKSPDIRTRDWARLELRERDKDDVVAALAKFVKGLDPKSAEAAHHKLEALWVHQHHHAVNEALLKDLLTCDKPEARAAATRVLCYWRDDVKDSLALLKKQANDEHPRVRLEAVRAASFYVERPTEAMEVALESLKYEQDDYLKYTLNETVATLEHALKNAK